MKTFNFQAKNKIEEEAFEAFLFFIKKLRKKNITSKNEESPYDPEFVKMIKESKQQIKDGKFKEFENMDSLRKYLKLDEL